MPMTRVAAATMPSRRIRFASAEAANTDESPRVVARIVHTRRCSLAGESAAAITGLKNISGNERSLVGAPDATASSVPATGRPESSAIEIAVLSPRRANPVSSSRAGK
jgi:hypothetical protein